jgi:class 3 adenylate cyclase
MSETRKLVAILVADVVGYSRLAGADEDRTLSRLRGLRGDLIDPAIEALVDDEVGDRVGLCDRQERIAVVGAELGVA